MNVPTKQAQTHANKTTPTNDPTPANGDQLGKNTLPPFHVSDDFTFELTHFSVPEHYAPDLSSVMIPHGLIMDRIDKLAVDIVRAYRIRELNTRLHMLCVLKGGHQFFADLCNALKRLTLVGVQEPPLTFDFIRVKSYQNTESRCALPGGAPVRLAFF